MATKNGYGALAHVYDKLNGEVDYTAWADFFEAVFDRFSKERPKLVLDLGCGTGAMTVELAGRGYDMTGIDLSPEMLSEAYRRAADNRQSGILLIEGDISDFELYGTVGAVVSCLDVINHLTDRTDVERCFSLVHNYLDPDGLFIFDVNTPYKFRNVYADNDYVLEEDGAVCVWSNRLSDDGTLCDFRLSVFERQRDGRYIRRNSLQSERCYGEAELSRMLAEAGFEICGIWGGCDFSVPDEKCERWYIAARAKK